MFSSYFSAIFRFFFFLDEQIWNYIDYFLVVDDEFFFFLMLNIHPLDFPMQCFLLSGNNLGWIVIPHACLLWSLPTKDPSSSHV